MDTDALTSTRPYKATWPLDKVAEQRDKYCDTYCDTRQINLFLNLPPEINLICRCWQDTQ